MIGNNCRIIMACFVAFDLCFVGERHLSPHRAPDCTLLDDDVVLLFQLRDTPDDEGVIHWWARARWGPSLLFQLFEPLDKHSGPNFRLYSSTWGFSVILLYMGPNETKWWCKGWAMGLWWHYFIVQGFCYVKSHVKVIFWVQIGKKGPSA